MNTDSDADSTLKIIAQSATKKFVLKWNKVLFVFQLLVPFAIHINQWKLILFWCCEWKYDKPMKYTLVSSKQNNSIIYGTQAFDVKLFLFVASRHVQLCILIFDTKKTQHNKITISAETWRETMDCNQFMALRIPKTAKKCFLVDYNYQWNFYLQFWFDKVHKLMVRLQHCYNSY